jgi:thiol peroxidase
MTRTILALFTAAALGACASKPATNEVQADLPVAKESARAGAGNNVSMRGNPVPLGGSGVVEVGKPLPAAKVIGTDLKPVDLGATTGKVRIISVVPSLDTPTCDKQTHELSEKNGGLDSSVEMITVSRDLPFAQKRFAREAKIGNVTFLSDYNMREFGDANGLTIEPLALLARAVIVVDKHNIVRYVQVVPEVTALPDMQAAMQVARGLL